MSSSPPEDTFFPFRMPASADHPLARRPGHWRPRGDGWVFGYGSLMWRPDFPHVETRPALLHGYHRALCIYSVRYRGTDECPGLVMGLERGGSCVGRAFRVAAARMENVISILQEREMLHRVYDPVWLPVTVGACRVLAYTFVARRDHSQYCGKLKPARAADFVLQGSGERGPCLEYLRETVRHMDELGVAAGPLHRILTIAERKIARAKP